jgi:hypothetical protein
VNGAAFGGILNAGNYAQTCAGSGGCSVAGLAKAGLAGAVAGAALGVATGAAIGVAKAVAPDAEVTKTTSCPFHSFTGATPVLMADGTTKPIDQIKTGDHIANSVPGQSTTQDHTVTTVIVTKTDHDFVQLGIKPAAQTSSATGLAKKAAVGLAAAVTAIATSSGASNTPPSSHVDLATGGTITTTFHHPFYDITQSAFIDAQNLKPGDQLQTPTGAAEITGVRLYHADTTTYDLTIGALHTYYVVAGSTPVLVHNINADECPISGLIVPSKSIVTPTTVFRGDLRSPDVVGASGFTARGANTDLMDYVINNTDSAWVGTSTIENRAAMFPKGKTGVARWVYQMMNPGVGVDVNSALGLRFRLFYEQSSEHEILFPGIDPSTILQARLWRWGQPTGEVWTNPEIDQ